MAALVGAYQSGITLTASAVAEKYGIPFINGESVAANLTERGFKWFFRTTPVALDFAKIYSVFLKEQKAAGLKVDSIALVHENTEYGNSVSSVISDTFAKDGLTVSMKVAYSANSTDVQPQVLQLKEKNPDVVIFISYTSDAILYAKTMKELGWKPEIMIADDGGFNDPAFVKAMGPQVEGADQPLGLRRRQARHRARAHGRALQEEDRRRRASTTCRAAPCRPSSSWSMRSTAQARPIRRRFARRSPPPTRPVSELIAGYQGVKFDEKGQNILGSTLVTQIRGGQYVSVWPKDRATDSLVLPYKGW